MSDETDRLSRIETKLDAYLKNADDHEARMRVLEAWRSRSLGTSAVAASGVAAVSAAVATAIQKVLQ